MKDNNLLGFYSNLAELLENINIPVNYLIIKGLFLGYCLDFCALYFSKYFSKVSVNQSFKAYWITEYFSKYFSVLVTGLAPMYRGVPVQ